MSRVREGLGCSERSIRPESGNGDLGPRFDGLVLLPGQAENDDPQPQVVLAFGFLITNCAPSIFS